MVNTCIATCYGAKAAGATIDKTIVGGIVGRSGISIGIKMRAAMVHGGRRREVEGRLDGEKIAWRRGGRNVRVIVIVSLESSRREVIDGVVERAISICDRNSNNTILHADSDVSM